MRTKYRDLDKRENIRRGQRIREIREVELKLNKSQMALELGISPQFLGLVEDGRANLVYRSLRKLRDISGHSTDFIASIKNKLSSPIDTEMFLDKYCNCYKWSFKKKAFVRNISANTTSPLLVDYEYLSNGSVLKKEYTGIK